MEFENSIEMKKDNNIYCNHGHIMTILKKSPYKGGEGIDYIICDGCRKTVLSTEGMIHCNSCKEDYCLQCAIQKKDQI